MTDEQLVAAFNRTEDQCHFEALVERHVSKTRSMVYGMVLNDHDADDLTQVIFLKAARYLHRFNGKAKFSTWLHRISMNAVYDFLKRRKRNLVESWEHVPDCGCPQPEPGRMVAGHESVDRIRELLGRLPEKLRAAITLTAIQGMTPAEAATAVQCPTATMYWRIHEARRKLRIALEEAL
jgi:RNA polymerase sigma-70 factor (ECF subfamily)